MLSLMIVCVSYVDKKGIDIVAVECEYFLLKCSPYEPLIDQYLPNNRTGHRTLFDFINTVTSSDTQVVVLLCKFFIMPSSVEMLIYN